MYEVYYSTCVHLSKYILILQYIHKIRFCSGSLKLDLMIDLTILTNDNFNSFDNYGSTVAKQ